MTYANVEAGFVDLMQLRLLAGRSFSLKRPAEQAGGLLLNRAATRALGYATPDEAIGSPIAYSHDGGHNDNAHVWGVVEDSHFESLHSLIRPMVMSYAPWDWAYSYTGIRIDPESATETIGFIRDTWDEFVPEMPIQWHFLDADFERLYRTEQRLSTLLASFAAMAIAIACMGVWALAANAGERRTKEIGVRKALGASEGGIVVLLAREFASLAMVANLLAWPLVYWLMDLWLQSFAYRAEMGWWLFLLGSVLVLACAVLAAVYQALQAARVDPVQALRWE
jgi:putative ABC transport system permease protein